MASLSTNKRNVIEPPIVEINELWRAMKLCCELGYISVVFEGDAQSTMKKKTGLDTGS